MESSKSKRQKVTTACEPCRSRKIKCDGVQPGSPIVTHAEQIDPRTVCSPCEKRPRSDTACTWATDFSRIPYSSLEYIRQLEERIKLLEGRDGETQGSNNQSTDSPPVNSVSRSTGHHAFSSPTSPGPATGVLQSSERPVGSSILSTPAATSTDMRLANPTVSVVPSSSVQPLRETRDSTEPLDISTGQPCHGPTGHESHSSDPAADVIARDFMQGLKKAITQWLGEVSNVRDSTHKSNKGDATYPLPSRQQADTLLKAYWNHVHVLYPFLDKQQVEQEYSEIWNQEVSAPDRKSFLCLLNAIFAVSSRNLRLATPNHEQLAATFCSRARELMDVDSCDIRSLQSNLLLALYFESIDKPRTCWMFTVLAVRTAQILELHLVETSEREPEPRQKDFLRRAWHGCVLLDREVSMMYDRPCMIDTKTAVAVPLPLLEEEETPTPEHEHSPRIHATDFHSNSLSLYNILYDVLLQTRASKVQRSSQPRHSEPTQYYPPFESNTSVVEIEERLSRWEFNLPRHYKFEVHSSYLGINPLSVQRAVILHQRHIHVHLLLLRPMLQSIISWELKNQAEDTPIGSLVSHRVSLQGAVGCAKMAQEAIQTIYFNEAMSSNEMRSLSAWWHNAIFLYTSATVLIAASLSPSVVAELQDSIYGSFYRATEILQQYTIFNPSTARLATALHILSSFIPKNYSRLKQSAKGQTGSTPEGAGDPATFRYWCPLGPNCIPAHDPKTQANTGQNDNSHAHILSDLDLLFDPDDFSWLTRIPFHI